jgi:hypothetical protein
MTGLKQQKRWPSRACGACYQWLSGWAVLSQGPERDGCESPGQCPGGTDDDRIDPLMVHVRRTPAAHKGRLAGNRQSSSAVLSYFVRAPSNQDLRTGAGAAPACLATILPSTITINVGTA